MKQAGAAAAVPLSLPRPGRDGAASTVTDAVAKRRAKAALSMSAVKRWRLFLRLSFLAVVILPVAGAVAYTRWFATPQYVSEALIAVRGSIEPKAPLSTADGSVDTSALSSLVGPSSGKDQQKNSLVVSSYVDSLTLVSDLNAGNWLQSLFNRDGIDPIARLPKDATIEQLWRYWSKHVIAAVDTQSGILLLRVTAFSPEDAQAIADRVVAKSEQMLNAMNERARKDTLKEAQSILTEAEARYEKALTAQQEWRTQQGAVDADQEATALYTNLFRLLGNRVAAQRDLDALGRLSLPSGPTAEVLNDQIRALDAQIADLERQLGVTSLDPKSVVNGIAGFEETELEKQFANTLLTIATTGFQDAQRRVRAQGVFVNVFVTPTLATESTEARWWKTPLVVLMMALIVWVNSMLLLAVIRDHRR